MKSQGKAAGTDILALIGKHRKLIMGFAAIYILIFHEYQHILSHGSFWYEIFHCFKRFGFMGVDVFFLLSGMGLTYSIHKTGVGMFYYKRLRRIAFPFLCIGIIRAVYDNWAFVDFVKNVTGINFWIKNMYSYLWFVPAIAAFYLLFPLYNKIFEKMSNKISFTGVVICIWLLLSMIFAGSMKSAGREEFYGFTNRIPVFVIGVLIGWLSQNRKLYIKGISWVFIILLNAVGFYLAIQTNYNNMFILVPISNCCIPNMLMAVSLTMLLVKLFDLLSKAKVGKPVTLFFGFFGMISLEFYCVQELLGRIILPNMSTALPIAKNIVLFAAVTLAATALYYAEKYFWVVLKLPFKKKKKLDGGNYARKCTSRNNGKNNHSWACQRVY